ncbi:MAG: LamG domain-containing protein, partial [Planctomycetota bacterium]
MGKRQGWTPRTNVKWFWEVQPDGDLVFRNGDAGVGYSSLILAPYANEWIHVAVTWDDGAIVQYVNAEEVLTGNLTFRDTADATVVSIGCVSATNSETFVGSIDEARIYDTALDVAEIVKAMTGDTTSATLIAPGNESTDVRRDISLRWSPGEFANTHDVYFGSVFADVNDASRTNPLGVLASQDQTATTYDPDGLLEIGQT